MQTAQVLAKADKPVIIVSASDESKARQLKPNKADVVDLVTEFVFWTKILISMK